jgi:hypothetical protein
MNTELRHLPSALVRRLPAPQRPRSVHARALTPINPSVIVTHRIDTAIPEFLYPCAFDPPAACALLPPRATAGDL